MRVRHALQHRLLRRRGLGGVAAELGQAVIDRLGHCDLLIGRSIGLLDSSARPAAVGWRDVAEQQLRFQLRRALLEAALRDGAAQVAPSGPDSSCRLCQVSSIGPSISLRLEQVVQIGAAVAAAGGAAAFLVERRGRRGHGGRCGCSARRGG